MPDYTTDEYHRRRHPEFIGETDLLKAWSHFADLAYFAGLPPGSAILEFGGGLGQNLLAVAGRADVCMVEPSALGRETAARYGIKASFSLDELGDHRFDRILCRHVLEHLDHPLRCLEDLHARLKPGGRLVVVVPVEDPLEPPAPDDPNHHLYGWNPQTLVNLLDRAAFTDIEWRFEYYGARRRLLPVYRLLGGAAYARVVRGVGRLFRFRELVATATPG